MIRPPLTPAELIAARRLLGWSKMWLSARMGISERAITRFENEGAVFRAFDPSRCRDVLEAAGVEFTNRGKAGVRLKKREPKKHW